MKQIIGGVLIGLVLAGCATQRPQMNDANYTSFARGWSAIGWCTNKGWIDVDVAARGRAYFNSAVGEYSFDRTRMAAAIEAVGKTTPPTQSECRTLAVDIQTRKQQIDNQNASMAIQQQETQNMINATKPTQTYCNKIGTQVFCNSY